MLRSEVKSLLPNLIWQAIENELSLDEELSKDEGFSSPVFRPLHKAKYGKLRYFFYLATSWFILISSPLFIFVSLFVRLKFDAKNDQSNKLWFVISKKASEILKRVEGDDESSKVGTALFCDGEKLSCSSISLYYQFLYLFLKRNITRPWTFRSLLLVPELTVFSNFLVESSFKNVHITNHYDRWAFMISHICKLTNKKLFLYQHGVLPEVWSPKYKLSDIYEIEVFDKKDLLTFESKVFSHISNSCILKPQISLSTKKAGYTVLIIGSGRQSQVLLELELCKKLSLRDNVTVCLKPHPVYYQNFKSYYQQLNKSIRVSLDSLPHADSIVHFGSTLALEYKNSLPNILDVHWTLSESSDEVLSMALGGLK